jgi:hypothetical protein
MNKLRLKEYTLIHNEPEMTCIVFEHNDNKIDFTIRENKITMNANCDVTMEIVEEAINIIKSRKIEF